MNYGNSPLEQHSIAMQVALCMQHRDVFYVTQCSALAAKTFAHVTPVSKVVLNQGMDTATGSKPMFCMK